MSNVLILISDILSTAAVKATRGTVSVFGPILLDDTSSTNEFPDCETGLNRHYGSFSPLAVIIQSLLSSGPSLWPVHSGSFYTVLFYCATNA